jgi:3-phosphoshikimate 1-carboxyvinyltransferase
MAEYIAIPPVRQVRGTVAAPPSKSATNRALILAALSETAVQIEHPLESGDTRALARCLAAMGATIAPSPLGLLVRGPLFGPADLEVTLDAGESGTAARFLAALAAATSGRFLLTGSERLRERPIGELVRALRSCGARIEYAGAQGHLPLEIVSRSLRSGRITVDASRSSQFLSALLLAGPALPEGLEVSSESGVASAPYVATTLECVRAFGHDVIGACPSRASGDSTAGPIRVTRGRVPVVRYRVPGDYSSALPLLASAGMAGGSVTVTGLAWPSGDADAGALAVLEHMGLEIEASAEAVTARSGPGILRPVTVIATDFPDAVPVLAALAARAPGPSRFEGIAHLRLKESDRIEAIASLLAAAGAGAQARSDSLSVEGAADLPAAGAARKLPTFGDHRIAMAAALLSLALPGFLIENPACVAKSYPQFFADLETLVLR